MLITRFGLLRLILSFTCVTGLASMSQAWEDDFSDQSITDNNPVSWITNLGAPDHEPGSFFPGIYSAATAEFPGDLLMDPDDDSPTGTSSAFVPVPFTDTYIRTQGKVLPDPLDPENNTGGNLVLTARIDAETLSGYIMYFDVSHNLNVQLLLGGATVDINGVNNTVDIPFNASEEVVIELNVVGNQLSGYAWLADDPLGKPAEPQLSVTDLDNTFMDAGISGIAYDEDDPFTSGVYRYVKAQGTPFIDAIPGDYNNDTKVDAADYVVWRNGDSPDDTQAGYDLWKANFGVGAGGAGSGSSLSAVPEPAGLVLVLAAIGASLLGGRRRTH